jgi:hypothetical protein
MEAFMEGYHGPQTHSQLLMGMGDKLAIPQTKNTYYEKLPGGHGRFYAASDDGTLEDFGWDGDAFVEFSRLLAEGQDAMTLDRDVMVFEGLRNKIPADDPNFPMAAINALYEHAAGAGIPMPDPSEHLMQWGAPLFIFPNHFIFPMYGNALCYRMRPHEDDPELTLYDVWSLTTYPEGHEPGRAVMRGVFDKDDSEHWRLIPRQDFANIERQQRGLHMDSFKQMRFSNVLEKLPLNLHEHIDRVIAAGEAAKEKNN